MQLYCIVLPVPKGMLAVALQDGSIVFVIYTQTFQTLPTLAPSHGRGEIRLALRFLPEIIHSEGQHSLNLLFKLVVIFCYPKSHPF